MKKTIDVIVKMPDEKVGHIETIPNELKAMQELVGGYIETLTLYNGAVLVFNEEGRLRDMELNFDTPMCNILGPAFVCGIDGDDFDDCPMDLKMWKDLLVAWGN